MEPKHHWPCLCINAGLRGAEQFERAVKAMGSEAKVKEVYGEATALRQAVSDRLASIAGVSGDGTIPAISQNLWLGAEVRAMQWVHSSWLCMHLACLARGVHECPAPGHTCVKKISET